MTACFALLNEAHFANLKLQIQAAGTSEELQGLVNQVYGDLSLLQSTIDSQLAALGPLVALLTAPTNLAELLTWIETFITGFLTPYLKPYVTLGLQVPAIVAEIAAMTALIESVASAKFPGITIEIPEVASFCTL